jgi:non-ribosomal peptide synthetase component F
LPFAAIVEAVRPQRAASHHPVFQVALTLLAGADEYAEIPGLNITRHDLDTATSKFDMAWFLQEADGALEGYVEYAADLFSEALIEQMVATLTAILEGLVHNSAATVEQA